MNTYDESIKAAWTEHYLFTPVAKDISKPCRKSGATSHE